MLEQHPDKIDWQTLSENPNAIPLLKKNQEKINWMFFTTNPSIFSCGEKESVLKLGAEALRRPHAQQSAQDRVFGNLGLSHTIRSYFGGKK